MNKKKGNKKLAPKFRINQALHCGLKIYTIT
jgi:hypothetical protein